MAHGGGMPIIAWHSRHTPTYPVLVGGMALVPDGGWGVAGLCCRGYCPGFQTGVVVVAYQKENSGWQLKPARRKPTGFL